MIYLGVRHSGTIFTINIGGLTHIFMLGTGHQLHGGGIQNGWGGAIFTPTKKKRGGGGEEAKQVLAMLKRGGGHTNVRPLKIIMVGVDMKSFALSGKFYPYKKKGGGGRTSFSHAE